MRQVNAAFVFSALAASATAAGAATATYNVNTNTGSSPVLYTISVHDDAPNLLTFAVAVAAESVNNADIAALYFNFTAPGARSGYTAADFSGSAITKVRFDTSNVQAGDIGETFQFGLGIGKSGSGEDFYDSFAFTMNLRNGLTLADLDFFGVRGQSVGPDSSFGNPGEESSKTFVERGEDPVPAPLVPLPSGAGLAGLGLLVLGARRRRSL